MLPNIQRDRLFLASCIALLVTSLSFGIRAGLLDYLERSDFTYTRTGWNYYQHCFLGFSTGYYYWRNDSGYHWHEKIIGSCICFSSARYYSYHFCQWLLAAVYFHFIDRNGNGTVEAACNPLVASLYTRK